MRVIAGTARSLPLRTPEGMDTRPTTDRIKETLFNMLQTKVGGSVFVDMLSGSGGICIQAYQSLFTGDTLFYDGFVRTDLGAGSVREMEASIERLYQMDPNLVVFPGHGISTTIGREANENPFMDF